MELANIFMDKLKVNANSNNSIRPNIGTSVSGNGFDMLLSQKMSNNSTNNNIQNTANNSNRPATRNQNSNSSSETRQNNNNTSSSNTNDTTNQTSNNTTSNTSNTTTDNKVNDGNSEVVESLDEKCIESLADELDIPKEVIEQILAQLNIKPNELLEPEKLNEFMQAAMEVDTPVELLNIPNINETFQNIKECITQVESQRPNVQVTDEQVEELVADEPAPVLQEEIAVEVPQQTDTVLSAESGDMENDMNFQHDPQLEYQMTSGQNTTESKEFRTMLAKNEATRNIDPKSVMKQMIEHLKVDVREGTTELKMVLRPESLGEVTLKIATQNGIIVAEFIAQSERIKEIIEANFNNLKDALEEKGLSVSKLSVSVGNQDSQDNMQRFLHEQKKSEARVSQIIKNLSEEDMLDGENELDQKEVLNSNVDYIA